MNGTAKDKKWKNTMSTLGNFTRLQEIIYSLFFHNKNVLINTQQELIMVKKDSSVGGGSLSLSLSLSLYLSTSSIEQRLAWFLLQVGRRVEEEGRELENRRTRQLSVN